MPISAIAGIAIFVVTYVLISARRMSWLGFDRPAGALAGAVACVLAGAITPAEAIAAINGATLLLLFGVMGMGAFLALDGFFDQVENRILSIARTPTRLLGFLVWSAGMLSAFITNDAVCVLGAPVLVQIIRKHDLPPLPFLLALATAANTGSVATLVGNPQNMLCGLLGGLSYREHLMLMGPVAILGLAVNHGLLVLLFRKRLSKTVLKPVAASQPLSRRVQLTMAVIAGTAAVYILGGNLSWTATGGFVFLMLLHRRDTRQLWPRIDWSLLLFFTGLFVVIEGLMKSDVPAMLFDRFPLSAIEGGLTGILRLSGVFLLGSNLVSNVPFILVVRDQISGIADPRIGWELLAMASTFAGNLTLLGSAANIIVAEASQDAGGIGFFQYFRVGFLLATATTIIGALWVSLMY
jgi:Na+/H+ antiporter NhaD/arsenite permease-like protein